MKTHQLLAKVYRTSSLITMAVMLALCLLFRWSLQSTLVVMLSSLVTAAPAVISLNATCWLLRRVALTPVFAWMILFAAIPVLVILPSVGLSNTLPGDGFFLAALGIMGSYISLLGSGHAIVKLFKSSE